ncbi:hypothetical protein G7046_g2990 [Stylonectria norvegica]|nr:hypothetical protein G7046_g2990 [Stylonectria norvegica]
MSNTSPVNRTTIEVESGVLPAPATKLVITQHLKVSRDPPFWAWIIVGAFYDQQDNIIWSTEVFAGHLNIELESDEESDAEEESQSQGQHVDTGAAAYNYSHDTEDSEDEEFNFQHPQQNYHPTFPQPASRHSPLPPTLWDPTRQGPVPGQWLSTFDPRSFIIIMSNGGWNPMTGRDATGARPTYAPAGAPVPTQGQPYIPHLGGPGYYQGAVPQYGGWAYGMNPMGVQPAPVYGAPAYGQYAVPSYGYAPHGAVGGFHTQQTFSYQPNGTGNVFPRQAQPYPNIDPAMPAAQMANSSGGVGCEPGYNYFFPAEHTKFHVFKSEQPPWQLPANAQIPFIATHVPCQTTIAELLKGFGCTNESAKKNRIFEIVSGGNGKWYKGMCFTGGDKDAVKMTVKDVGWDASRTGLADGKPVVCVWFSKS